MATKIQLRGGTMAQWATANPILASREPAIETDTGKMKIGNGSTPWNDLPYGISFIELGADASEIQRGLVEAADDLEMQNGTDIGATGALVFVRPSKLRVYRDISESVAVLAGSTLTCNCAGKLETRHYYNGLSGNASVIFSNKGNSQLHSITISITGTSILTFESDTRMARYNELTNWNQVAKALTVTSTVAGDLHEFSLLKTGSIYILRYDGPVRA